MELCPALSLRPLASLCDSLFRELGFRELGVKDFHSPEDSPRFAEDDSERGAAAFSFPSPAGDADVLEFCLVAGDADALRDSAAALCPEVTGLK